MKKIKNFTSFSSNKLTSILRTFSVDEMNNFRRFISSPYFDKGRSVLKLYDALKEYYPGFYDKNLTKELLFAKLYPGKNYNDTIMRKQMSVLWQLAQEYLVQLFTERDKTAWHISLLSEYSFRSIDKLFSANIRKVERKLSETGWKDEKYFHNKLQLQDIILSAIDERTAILKSIEAASSNLTDYFLVKKLRYLYQLIILCGGEEIKNRLFDEIKYFIEKNSSGLLPIEEIYFNIILAIKSDTLKPYYKARNLVKKNFNNLDRHHRMVFLVALQNIVINNINRGLDEFREEWKEIFKTQFKHGLLYNSSDEAITYTNYRNIILLGLRVEATDMIEEFIYFHYERIRGESRESMLNFSLAHLFFKKNDYSKSIEYSSKVDFETLGGAKKNYAFYLDIKKLLLMCYYELGYYDEALSAMDTLRHFLLKSGKVPEIIISQHKNFLRFYNSLLQQRYNNRDINTSDLEKQVQECTLISKKDWIISKINKLKGSLV